MLFKTLKSYSSLTLYEEEREENKLMFSKGVNYDVVVENEDNPEYINIEQSNSSGFCMINRNLQFQVENLKFGRDKVVIGNDLKKIIFLCKKNIDKVK